MACSRPGRKRQRIRKARISLRRAKAVESYLKVKHGIPPDRIIVKGYGENAPIATNETKEGQARNRRVELLAAGKEGLNERPTL